MKRSRHTPQQIIRKLRHADQMLKRGEIYPRSLPGSGDSCCKVITVGCPSMVA